MPDTKNTESTFLFLTEGRSDKVYNAHLREKGSGWIVTYENGPRGSTLRMGRKTTSPVDYATARKVFDKLVGEKTKKGLYQNGERGHLF